MSATGDKFLVETLGEDGASALRKAADRHPDLGGALLPRAIIAWLAVESRLRDAYSGDVPGTVGVHLDFKKSEHGFAGSVMLPGGRYDFEGATMFHVAGAVAVALEADVDAAGRVRDADVERLGKSIDTLAKARAVTKELRKSKDSESKHAFEPTPAGFGSSPDKPNNDHDSRHCRHCSEESGHASHWDEAGLPIKKIEPPGQSAKPMGPTAAAVPEAPKAKATAAPRATGAGGPGAGGKKAGGGGGGGAGATMKAEKKSPAIRLMKSEAERRCKVCGHSQFNAGSFAGCLCFKSLAKSVSVIPIGNQIQLVFGKGWDRESVLTLAETWGR